MAQQAKDSFSTIIDGAPVFVSKGEVLPEGHPVLRQLGADTPNLFRRLEEDEPPVKGRAAKGAGGG